MQSQLEVAIRTASIYLTSYLGMDDYEIQDEDQEASVESNMIHKLDHLVKNQPANFDYPKCSFGNGHLRSFNKNWYNHFPWLHYNEEKDAAFCFTCMTADMTKVLRLSTKQDKAFISTGYTNWNKGQDGLKKHETSKCHQEACEVAALTNKFPDTGETLSDFHAVEKANNRQMFITILQNIRYLARQGIPF